VPVCVAGGTSLTQAEKCLPTGFVDEFENLLVLDILFCVAVFTQDGRVFAGSRKTGERVIESLLVEEYCLCISPQMFFVARDAWLRRHFEVVAASGIERRGDLLMADKALLPADLISGFMTLQAVVDPLELPMHCREFSRRELSAHRPLQAEQQHHRSETGSPLQSQKIQ
jgi:hypothetical protein